ncbi:MAG: DUF3300 domain-containing protein [Thiohalocapsa sp.]
MRARTGLMTGPLIAVLIAFSASICVADDAANTADPFPPEQIEQLVAPIALYPDALIAQLLMASTYPLDVVQANRWVMDNTEVEGEALQTAVDAEAWDDSIKSLVFFPSVLGFMNDNLDWTQDLGDAVLAQQGDVTDAIQRLRDQADAAGALTSNEQQRVEKAGDTIVIQPAQPEVVYVPTYDPVTTFGASSPPATQYYPDTYADAVSRYEEGYAAGLSAGTVVTPATTQTATTSDSGSGLVNFGLGAVAGGLLTAAILWDNDDDDRIYYGGRGYYGAPSYWAQPNYWNNNGWSQPNNISVDRNLNLESGAVNINKGLVGNEINRNDVKAWQHNPERRGSVRYRDASTEQRFTARRKETTIDRDTARGRLRDGDRKLKAPDLSQVKREGAASGGLAQLSERRGDGVALGELKGNRPASADARAQLQATAPAAKAQIQNRAPAAKAKVQAKAPAAKAKIQAKPKTKPKVAAAAKKRPVNTTAKRPPVKQLKRPPSGASKPKIAAKAKVRSPAKSSAFKAKSKPNVARKASARGGASRAKSGARSGGGKVRRRG